MAPTKRTQEMPAGDAALFALVGTVIFLAFGQAFVWPTLWAVFAYRPAVGTVEETRPTRHTYPRSRPAYGLEARLAFDVGGRRHDGWVELPGRTRETEGPEADAVAGQARVGQQVPCLYDPLRPGNRVLLARPPLTGALAFATAFPLLFVAVGVAGLVRAWKPTFPDGPAAAVEGVARRLPRSFFVTLLDLAAVAAVTAAALRTVEGWGFPVLLAGGAAAVWLARRAFRLAAVAFPSPERLAALGPAAGHPEGGVKAGPFTPAAWSPAPRVAVHHGRWLPVGLTLASLENTAGGRSAALLAAGLAVSTAALVIGAGALAGWAGAGSATRQALLLVTMAGPAAAWGALGLRSRRRSAGVRVELSGHPLRAGCRYDVALWHPEPAECAGLSATLERWEESRRPDARSKKSEATSRHTAAAVAFPNAAPPAGASPRRGRLDVPDTAVGSVSLEFHKVEWALNVRLKGWLPLAVRFPLTVEPAADVPAAKPPVDPDMEPGHDSPGRVWLDGGPAFAPGAPLSGSYAVEPADERVLDSVELSVQWETGGPGRPEQGVCHYEARAAVDGDDLSLYGARPFALRLPAGPPSYNGPAVQIRWRVRLRLRYADGTECLRDHPFALGRAAP